jgi:PPM family protein phosphatase
VAAKLAVEAIQRVVGSSDARQPGLSLQEAFLAANQAINSSADANPAYLGMGTTAACVWVIGDRLFIASVGDSRIYLRRGEKILQLSTDHTWVQEAVDSGVLTLQEARNHPNAHVIRRHLGSQDGVIPDLRLRLAGGELDAEAVANQGLSLLPGDSLLLCTDGLTDLVEDNEILSAFKSERIEGSLSKLVDLANTRGGHDNITLVGLRVPPIRRKLKSAAPASLPRRTKALLYVFYAVVFLFLIGALLSGYYLFEENQATSTVTPAGENAPLILPSIVPTGQPPSELISGSPEPGSELPPGGIIQSAEAESPILTPATNTPWPTSTARP